jgi:transposase
MSLMGVDIGYAIVDAGYYSDGNVKSLFDNRIPFLTRMKANKTIYTAD